MDIIKNIRTEILKETLVNLEKTIGVKINSENESIEERIERVILATTDPQYNFETVLTNFVTNQKFDVSSIENFPVKYKDLLRRILNVADENELKAKLVYDVWEGVVLDVDKPTGERVSLKNDGKSEDLVLPKTIGAEALARMLVNYAFSNDLNKWCDQKKEEIINKSVIKYEKLIRKRRKNR